MLIERIVAKTSAGSLLGGLDWRPPSHGVHSKQALQEVKRQTDSTHYALLQAHGFTRYGLYKSRISEESINLPKGVLSAAACFANLVGAHAPNAALVLPVEFGNDRSEQKYLVIVLEDGIPHIDALVNEMSARDTVGSEERPMWAFSHTKYPNCQIVNFEWLASGADKAARVQSIPINPWPIMTLLALSLIAGLGWWGYDHLKSTELAKLQAAQAAAADPIPKYLSALRAQAANMATKRSDVLEATRELFNIVVTLPGWQLKSLECNALTQQCLLNWARKGGTTEDIQHTLAHDTLLPMTNQGSPIPMIDQTHTVKKWPIQRESLLDSVIGLPSLQQGFSEFMPMMQVWKTAGLAIDIKAPSLWPSTPGVPNLLKHPSALHRGQIVIGSVPGPFIEEVLASVPRWIQWETVSADLGEGSDPRSRLSFKAIGTYYVSSH
jgi:hypothetical protein